MALNLEISGSGSSSGSGSGGMPPIIDLIAKVGQTVRVKSVDGNGKPTAWEAVDYQSKTHWTEVVDESVGILPLTAAQFEEAEGIRVWTMNNAVINYDGLIAGNTYIVSWNDVQYESILKYPPIADDGGNIIGEDPTAGWLLGNIGVISGGEDTGEPFILQISPAGGIDGTSIMGISFDESASVILSIKSVNKIENHTIDSKYLDLAWKPRCKKYVWTENFVLAAGEQQRINETIGDYEAISNAINSPDTVVMALVYIDGTPCETYVYGTPHDIGAVITIRDAHIIMTGPLNYLLFSNGDSVDHTFSICFLEYDTIPDKFLTTKKYINSAYGYATNTILTAEETENNHITKLGYLGFQRYLSTDTMEQDRTREDFVPTLRYTYDVIQHYIAPLTARIEALENSTT